MRISLASLKNGIIITGNSVKNYSQDDFSALMNEMCDSVEEMVV
jgi:hypothetical protein